MELETVLGEIKSLRSSQEASIQRLQRTYKEHGAFTIEQMLVNINTTIDECGNSYLGTSDENLQLYIKEEMCRGVVSILNVFDESTVKELNEMKEEVISIKESITCSINKCTDLQNDLTQYCDITQKLGDNKELCFIFRIKSKNQIERALYVLGKLDQLLICVQGKSEKNVRISSDSYTPEITAICVLPDGQVIVADFSNNKVKLLNQQYQVVGYLGVSAYPLDMCQITPNCVAVALNDGDDTTHEVQFIAVNNSKLLTRRKFQLQHACTGIAHYHGELFICSGTVLYKYTLSGKQVFPLYEVIQDDTDISCAVSPAGDRLYMACLHPESFLLTLASDGTLLSVFTESDLAPTYVHVTPEGQVLVCAPDGIIQVDREGERQLDILVQEEEGGLYDPLSVCYSRLTSSIIVGRNGNSILVFRAL
ncbi:uncharacterized protein LOC127838893 isoform X2 [Dreissena polymorpha]|nr:uncharacterized protein LOC127838893 isoform X2 [Dreissena polymorpha]